MRVPIVFNEPAADASSADLDVLQQVACVRAALERLGHEAEELPCTLDLAPLRVRLEALAPDCVVNLVESLGGSDRLAVLVPVLLELTGIPYTGCRASTALQLADKVRVKSELRTRGLPTPDWVTAEATEVALKEAAGTAASRFIVKPRFEHASVGLDDASVVDGDDLNRLSALIAERSRATGMPLFAERYIEGREFNIAMVGDGTGSMRLMDPAEIDFSAFPEGKLRIVGYDAKWNEGSFEYHATPRNFSFPEHDRALVSRLAECCTRVWDEFEGLGYARVDFRVDEGDKPFILEINSNPCLSPDAGFYAAVEQSGYGFDEAVRMMLEYAAVRTGHAGASTRTGSNAPGGIMR